ncbi:hypothetical protein [Salinispira pacifica]|uniref:Uncharacterized protein n=1 Tax=Salinispira pacifica TaxID=1307761 RepID=V5WM73_9SPIO|nr:hypothetical protein [Salinispira pacifica]AHC16738.1 hypothetical protein L21SP2_3400 [Salinispira pacifica]
MEKRVIGSSGVEVHPIGIGLWAIALLSGNMNRDSSFQEGDFRNNWLKDPERSSSR